MKKLLLFCLTIFISSLLFAQEVIDLGGIESIKIESVKKDEQFISAKIGTKEGFQLILSAKKTNGEERILAKIAHFSAYEKLCEDGKYYFSIDNHFLRKQIPDLTAELFVLDIKKGTINKVLDSLAFTVSNDGKYICYCEVPQKMKKENHEVSYWYIFDTKKKKSKTIIDKKQKNNWDVFISIYDEDTQSFIFNIGYDDVVMDKISFNPYTMDFKK